MWLIAEISTITFVISALVGTTNVLTYWVEAIERLLRAAVKLVTYFREITKR